MAWPKITLFGDSITRRSMDPENGCWGSMIANQVGSYLDVDVRGFEGYNTKWALEIMPKLFPDWYLEQVEVFVIFFGHNDAWEPSAPQHVPAEQYEDNMGAIIKYLTQNGLSREKIIVITPGWYHGENWTNFRMSSGQPVKGKELEDSEKYCEAAIRVAKRESVEMVDFFRATLSHKPFAELFCDGLHLSTRGAKLLFDSLMPIIRKKLELKFGKPLADLWHVIPYSERPECR